MKINLEKLERIALIDSETNEVIRCTPISISMSKDGFMEIEYKKY